MRLPGKQHHPSTAAQCKISLAVAATVAEAAGRVRARRYPPASHGRGGTLAAMTAVETTSVRLSGRTIWTIFSGLMLAMLLAALDQTIVATALPTIVRDLGGAAHLSWIVTAYLLASTVTTPLWGKLGDLYGRKTLFLACIVLFLAGSGLHLGLLHQPADRPDRAGCGRRRGASRPAPAGVSTRPRIDYAGVALLATVATSIILITSLGGTQWGWTSAQVVALSIVVVVGLVALVYVESRAAEPVLPPRPLPFVADGRTHSRVRSSLFMFILGVRIGLVIQVLVLAVQNAVEYRDLGTGTSGATFFRSIGSSVGVAVFGTVFINQLHLTTTAAPVSVYAHAIHVVFLSSVPIGLLAFALAWLIPQVPLRAAASQPEPGEVYALPTDRSSLEELRLLVWRSVDRDTRLRAHGALAALAGTDLTRARPGCSAQWPSAVRAASPRWPTGRDPQWTPSSALPMLCGTRAW